MSELPLGVWLLLTAIAVGTSIVSGVMGLAGGMLLLAVMLHWLDPLVAIPVHGVVQLVSNASRAWFQRAHVHWGAVGRFAWPLLPAGALGLWLLRAIPPETARFAIGGFVLLATWAPGVLRIGGRAGGDPRRALPLGGALVGFVSTTIGATGPLLAPFVLALGLAPPATVGTIAACQVLQHGVKLALFGAAGFDFAAFALPALALCAAAIVGSALGARLLDRVPERAFRTAVRLVLTALALRLLADAWLGP
ncbi:MAG TPA: sulfite exporter TauE/SafE family protein [Myxococcota bacterium]